MRYALISGGTGGLGQAVVKRFLSAGYHVTIADLPPQNPQLLSRLTQGTPAADSVSKLLNYVQLNVLKAEDREALAENLQELDVLVNLVGGFAFQSFAETSEKDLDQMFNLNLRSSFLFSQTLLPHLTQAEHGRIINVGSRQAIHGGAMVSAYALSKAAVVNLTQSLALELLKSSVTVNAVIPSIIDTPNNRSSMPDADFDDWVSPEDLAEAILFLASPEARAISGALIPVYHKA